MNSDKQKIKMAIDGLKFDDRGLIPAIAQDAGTLEVLMMAYMNKESLDKTISTGKAHYYSRSRKKLWLKGETSGNFQEVKAIFYDCDADTLLVMVNPLGPACHTGERTCFYRSLDGNPAALKGVSGKDVLTNLEKILQQRKGADPAKSYVAGLYSKGLAKILEKVREESAELIEAATVKEKKDVVYELCDLWFHTMVLLSYKDIGVKDALAELARRFGTSGIEEKESRKK